MQAEQQSDLLPCPFCGGEATRSKTMDESLWSHETVPYHKVYCPECEIGTEYRCEGWDPTAEEAWNTRAALSHPSPQWLPIYSAPKDGTRVILAWGGRVINGFYLDNSKSSHPWEGWRVESMIVCPPGKPTLWQPFPQLPRGDV